MATVDLDEFILTKMTDRQERRVHTDIEEDFIHHSVLAALSHGGLSPTQIAQMRNLCVLFIGMTSLGSSTNWLMEVQSILDVNRCPIIQIIHDDKGTVAAETKCRSRLREQNLTHFTFFSPHRRSHCRGRQPL